LTDGSDLEIARIHLAVSVEPPLRLSRLGPSRGGFQRIAPDLAGHVEVEVTLKAGELPETRSLVPLFETGGTWRAYRDGRDVLLVHTMGPDPDQLLWVLRLPAAEDHVEVTVGPDLLRRVENGLVPNPLRYPIDQLLLIHLLPRRDGVLLHAAGVRRDGRALLFAGRSGAGKSTLTRLALRQDGWDGLSDDRMIVRLVDSEVLAFGTPWGGTDQIAVNQGAPLGALAFLHQAPRNRLQRLEPRRALEQLLPVASILWFDVDRMTQSLTLCEQLLERVPAYELHFRDEVSILETLAELP
jgi:hypothetical protein